MKRVERFIKQHRNWTNFIVLIWVVFWIGFLRWTGITPAIYHWFYGG